MPLVYRRVRAYCLARRGAAACDCGLPITKQEDGGALRWLGQGAGRWGREGKTWRDQGVSPTLQCAVQQCSLVCAPAGGRSNLVLAWPGV